MSRSGRDVTHGIVLVSSQLTEEFATDLAGAPRGRVPEQLPDRTLSTEGRMIHAMLLASAATSKRDPPRSNRATAR